MSSANVLFYESAKERFIYHKIRATLNKGPTFLNPSSHPVYLSLFIKLDLKT